MCTTLPPPLTHRIWIILHLSFSACLYRNNAQRTCSQRDEPKCINQHKFKILWRRIYHFHWGTSYSSYISAPGRCRFTRLTKFECAPIDDTNEMKNVSFFFTTQRTVPDTSDCNIECACKCQRRPLYQTHKIVNVPAFASLRLDASRNQAQITYYYPFSAMQLANVRSLQLSIKLLVRERVVDVSRALVKRSTLLQIGSAQLSD